jgi:hypothetical protein
MREHLRVEHALLVIVLAVGAFAQDSDLPPPPKKPGVRITFLPPPLEGTLSLGIFDKAGKLVRTLHREATTKDFVVGLNGLITWWDGKDDAGALMPAGKYFARGYAVGTVEFQGEAFHCNDWIDDGDEPRFQRITDLRAAPDGLRLIAAVPGGTFVSFVAGADGRARDFHSTEKAAQFLHPMNAPDADAKWTPIREAAAKFAGQPVIALDGEEVILAQSEGRLLLCEKGAWRWLELPTLQKAVHACLGRAGTFWVIDESASGPEVKQYSFAGEFQRRLAIAPEDPAPKRVAAETTSDTIALLEESPERQRVRRLTLVASAPPSAQGEPSSTWKVTFSKTIRANGDLAAVQGELKTSGGTPFAAAEKVNVRLLPNQLVRNSNTNADLTVGFDAKGSFLRTLDGLPLKRITETPGLLWVAMMPEPAGRGVTIFQSDGAVVEEFKARKLASMMAFDAGDYEWSGKP